LDPTHTIIFVTMIVLAAVFTIYVILLKIPDRRNGNKMKIDDGRSDLKILRADSECHAMRENELEKFLKEGKRLMRLVTITGKNEPRINPVWYLYKNGKLLFITSEKSRKVRDIQGNNIVAFCIDQDPAPYRGVRGRGEAEIIFEPETVMEVTKELILKYLGNLDNAVARRFLKDAKMSGVVVEIKPKAFVTWK